MDIKETKEVLEVLKGALDEIEEKSADGKLTTAELFGLADNVMELVTELKDATTMKEELKDLDQDEVVEVAGYAIDYAYTAIAIVTNLKKKATEE